MERTSSEVLRQSERTVWCPFPAERKGALCELAGENMASGGSQPNQKKRNGYIHLVTLCFLLKLLLKKSRERVLIFIVNFNTFQSVVKEYSLP